MNPIRHTGQTEAEHEDGGYIKGVAIGLVTQNKDEEGVRRVKVSYPWHEKPLESYWARLSMPMANKEPGSILVPEVGDEVLVAFEGGDLRFPFVIGALWNGKDKPPDSNNDGKIDKPGLRSEEKHYLLLDEGDHGVVELAHKKGRKITFDDQGFSVQDENGNTVKVDSSSGAMTLEAKGTLSIKAASISIEATGTIEVKASATLTILGSLVNIN
jgi:uncharacterized protein involved in type VI secretion and phage assembly